jgi:hypothetical protein
LVKFVFPIDNSVQETSLGIWYCLNRADQDNEGSTPGDVLIQDERK